MEDLVQQTQMNWHNAGPRISGHDINNFERKIGKHFPRDLAWLLAEVSNGGAPPEVYLAIPELGPEEAVIVQGIYGIAHPDPAYSFEDAMDDLLEFGMERGFPFGYDQGGWQIVIVEKGPLKNQIRLIPWDEYCDTASDVSYFVASNMREFVALLNNKST